MRDGFDDDGFDDTPDDMQEPQMRCSEQCESDPQCGAAFFDEFKTTRMPGDMFRITGTCYLFSLAASAKDGNAIQGVRSNAISASRSCSDKLDYCYIKRGNGGCKGEHERACPRLRLCSGTRAPPRTPATTHQRPLPCCHRQHHTGTRPRCIGGIGFGGMGRLRTRLYRAVPALSSRSHGPALSDHEWLAALCSGGILTGCQHQHHANTGLVGAASTSVPLFSHSGCDE